MPIAEGYLLDTSVASPAWDRGDRRHETTRERLIALGRSPIFISVVTLAEVDFGLMVAPSPDPHRQEIVRENMYSYEILDINEHTAIEHAQIKATLFNRYATRDVRGRIKEKYPDQLIDRVSGKELGIQENDLWIASVAKQYNLVLVTADRGMRKLVECANYEHRTQFWTENAAAMY